ncbi:Golgi to ER traffic protein 4 homolog [Anneissia japonica]|uniref:Golgi to ER traffic protein 4 homolog n=1 Tax=Anneissia japonica TaxID=1529436 RepID=UPI00142595C5|nr:Golgi to ER traffic protein 4 homolog [Anneissia japonica]
MATKHRNGGGGVDRVSKKLQASVERGDYYEAHQMYKTLYFRFMNQNKLAEAIELIYSGANLLLEHNQHVSGADLCILLVEAFDASDAPVNSANIAKVTGLYKQIPADIPEREHFLSAALKWSAKGNPKKGCSHPELHQQVALIFWNEKSYALSRYHFVHSMDGKQCATMLVEFHTTQGYPSEVDMFITQVVFQLLCRKNKATANETFQMYTETHPNIEKGPPFILPLLNFLWFLLIAVDNGKLTTFTVLCEKYKPSLQKDPTYNSYLDKIGQIFFGLPPPAPSGPQGIIGNIVKSLFADGDESNGNISDGQDAELCGLDLD